VIPQHFDADTDPCRLASKWTLENELSFKLVAMASGIPFGLTIYSGFRTAARQAELEAAGRPTAPDRLSTHRACPSQGADVRFTLGAANLELTSRVLFGHHATLAGLRWGGGGPVNDRTGIPVDWNHLDLGPRS